MPYCAYLLNAIYFMVTKFMVTAHYCQTKVELIRLLISNVNLILAVQDDIIASLSCKAHSETRNLVFFFPC